MLEGHACAKELSGGAVGQQVQRESVGVAAAKGVPGDPDGQPLPGSVHDPRDLFQVPLGALVEAAVHFHRSMPSTCQKHISKLNSWTGQMLCDILIDDA